MRSVALHCESIPYGQCTPRCNTILRPYYIGVRRSHSETTQGPLAFWRGSGALYGKLAPHTLIVLVLTDTFRHWLGVPTIL
jgi:hypothetical protein